METGLLILISIILIVAVLNFGAIRLMNIAKEKNLITKKPFGICMVLYFRWGIHIRTCRNYYQVWKV